jgi:hypothetical protein
MNTIIRWRRLKTSWPVNGNRVQLPLELYILYVDERCNSLYALAPLEKMFLACATSDNPRIFDYIPSVLVIGVVFMDQPIDRTVAADVSAVEKGLVDDVRRGKNGRCRDRSSGGFSWAVGLDVRETVLMVNARIEAGVGGFEK